MRGARQGLAARIENGGKKPGLCWPAVPRSVLEYRGYLIGQSHQFLPERRINPEAGGNPHELYHDAFQAVACLDW